MVCEVYSLCYVILCAKVQEEHQEGVCSPSDQLHQSHAVPHEAFPQVRDYLLLTLYLL